MRRAIEELMSVTDVQWPLEPCLSNLSELGDLGILGTLGTLLGNRGNLGSLGTLGTLWEPSEPYKGTWEPLESWEVWGNGFWSILLLGNKTRFVLRGRERKRGGEESKKGSRRVGGRVGQ